MTWQLPLSPPPPEQLADISELGYWGKGPIFSRWPVDPVAYMSYGENRPDFLPDPFAKLEHWITTWGLAALEASLAHKELKLRLQISLECLENKRAKLASGAQPASDMSDSPYGAECKHLAKHAPEVLTALHLWQETAAAQCPADPVDISMLREISAIRSKLAGAMSEDSLEPRRALNGDANAVWSEVLYKLPAAQGRTFFGQEGHEVLSTVAPEFHSFIETYVTDWHHYRLFGLEPEFPNNWETINHQDPLISIGKDQLLGTKSEHDYGFSVWLNDADIAAGIYTGGQFIRHCAV